MGGRIVDVNLVSLTGLFDRAFWRICIGRGERGAHVLEADTVFEQSARIEFDTHSGQRTAAHLHLSDAIRL